MAYRNVVVDESNGQGTQCRQHLEGQEEEQHVVDARELLVWARQGEIRVIQIFEPILSRISFDKVAKGALGHGPIGGFHGSRSVFNNLNSPAARRRSRGNYMAELTEFRKVVKERFYNTSRVSAGEENTHCGQGEEYFR